MADPSQPDRPPPGTMGGAGGTQVTNAEQLGAWLATQPKAVQDQYIQQYGNQKIRNGWTVKGAVSKALGDAYRQGKVPDGVGQDGSGIDWSYGGKVDGTKEQARATIGRKTSIQGNAGQDIAAGITPDSYTYTPTTDAGYAPALHPEDQYNYQGGADPLQTQALHRSDETGVNAQKGILAEYKSEAAQGGLSAIDRARIAQSQSMRGQEARGRDAAAMQTAEQMGRAGGNASLLGKMRSTQTFENQRSQDDLQTNALGLERKDHLLGAAADLGGSIQSATDLIDKWNNEYANKAIQSTWDENNKRQTTNTQTHNTGVTEGLGYGAGLSAGNTAVANAAGQFNAGAHQQATDEKMKALGFATGPLTEQSGTLQHQADRQDDANAQSTANVLGGIGSVINAGQNIFKTAMTKQPPTS